MSMRKNALTQEKTEKYISIIYSIVMGGHTANVSDTIDDKERDLQKI